MWPNSMNLMQAHHWVPLTQSLNKCELSRLLQSTSYFSKSWFLALTTILQFLANYVIGL